MFIPFFLELKAAKIPVSLREFLTLLEGMEAGLVEYDVEGFYYLARAALVKDERHIDRFDQVFAHVFKGVEALTGEEAVDVRELPEEWLRRLAEKHLTEEEKKLVEALGGFDKLMETLRQRLEEQKGRHQGGSKWIGTAGTSPFGAYGYNPEGVRIGQDESRHRRAVKVWDKREFRNFDDSVELGTRNIKVALKRLRRWVREGAEEELDLPGTIHATAEHGYLDVQTRPERRNAVKLLMFFDVGGSMDDHVKRGRGTVLGRARRIPPARIFLLPQLPLRGRVEGQSAAPGPKSIADLRPAPQIWPRLQGDLRRRRLDEPLRDRPCRAARSSTGTRSPACVWLARVLQQWPNAIWINPAPQTALGLHAFDRDDPARSSPTACIPLTLAGLEAATRAAVAETLKRGAGGTPGRFRKFKLLRSPSLRSATPWRRFLPSTPSRRQPGRRCATRR